MQINQNLLQPKFLKLVYFVLHTYLDYMQHKTKINFAMVNLSTQPKESMTNKIPMSQEV